MRKAILKISEYILAIGTVAGGALWLDARFDAEETRDKELKQEVEYINVEQSMMAHDISDIIDTLDRLEHKVDNNAVGIYTNRRMMEYERQHRDEFTQEQMEEIIEEIKKNGFGLTTD